MRVLGDAREKLPLYSIINGVYEDKFFALVSASSIVERRMVHPKYFHGELSNIKEDDNAVLAFFRTTHWGLSEWYRKWVIPASPLPAITAESNPILVIYDLKWKHQ